LASDH